MSEISKVEERLLSQIEKGNSLMDIKIDLKEFLNHSHILKEGKVSHKFLYEDIKEQDCLLLQVPNINESGYYAGVVALKSYIDKFHSDLKIAIIDPIIDYFFLNPPDKQSEFFNLFNTYAKQGQYQLLFQHKEMYDMAEGFLFKYIDKTNPGFIGFSIIDGNIDASLALAKLTKERYPHIKILFGGNGIEVLDFGALPNTNYKTEQYNFVDIFSRGDGEITFVELLKSDFSSESLKKINGIVWRKDGKLVHNYLRGNISLNDIPSPDYSSLEENYYYNSTYQYNVPLVLSRGCPYKCTFCTVPEFIPEFRYRTIDSVLEEIQHWIDKGKVNFFCHDSIINGNPKWFKEFCERIIEKGWPEIGFSIGGNMRLGKPMRDLETMRLYRRAGLLKMITGFESASEPVLTHMKKYPNMEGVKEIFENVRIINNENKWPMQFAMQLIIGYLNETEKDFQKTYDFVAEYHDTFSEILTCSAFLLHNTLKINWASEGEYLKFHNTVNFETNYNTPEERLDWLDRIKALFEKIGINHSVYNRGLYLDLKDKTDDYIEIYNENTKIEKIINE